MGPRPLPDSPAPPRSAEQHWVRTRDGWRLALYRYPTRFRTSRWGPVLLFHGLGANRHNLDSPVEEISLARYLAARAHDVWVVELRGAGRSRRKGWPLSRRRVYDFDDYAQKDVPSIVRYVLDTTGYPSFSWVGHSMGGMLAYAAMIQYDQRIFRRVVAIGSPVFTSVRHPAVDLVYRLRGLLKVINWVPAAPLAAATALLPRLTLDKVGWLAGNPDNLEAGHMRRMAGTLSDLPAPLLAQFAEWYGSGFAQSEGLLDYWEHLDRVRAPLLIIAGPQDQLCPLPELERVFQAVGSREKSLVVASRAEGFDSDYGHIDLVLGKDARREIYPHISDWLERED